MKTLLTLLSDGEFHSGSDIGHVLGVSRTAVWKSLKKLEDLGVDVESVKGKGYRIVNGLELLSYDEIGRFLQPNVASSISHIDIQLQTASTNSFVMSLQSSQPVHGYVSLAEYQSAGRGRRGRQWLSPFACNIYLSVGWEFSEGASQLEGLSLAVGVVVADVLEALGVADVQLKWPNDILVGGEKLGGILLEMVGDPSGQCLVVAGIGLNVNMPDSALIDQAYTSVARHVSGVSRNYLTASLLNSLLPMLENFQHKGFSHYLTRWRQLDAYYDKEVRVTSGSDTHIVGVAKGVLPNGALRVITKDQEHEVCGGEVSLRLS